MKGSVVSPYGYGGGYPGGFGGCGVGGFPGYGFGGGCGGFGYGGYGGGCGFGWGSGFALIVVLFILLIIIGATCVKF